MHDWKGAVRERLTQLNLHGAAESGLTGELAQHLHHQYGDLHTAHGRFMEDLLKDVPLRPARDAQRLAVPWGRPGSRGAVACRARCLLPANPPRKACRPVGGIAGGMTWNRA